MRLEGSLMASFRNGGGGILESGITQVLDEICTACCRWIPLDRSIGSIGGSEDVLWRARAASPPPPSVILNA